MDNFSSIGDDTEQPIEQTNKWKLKHNWSVCGKQCRNLLKS